MRHVPRATSLALSVLVVPAVLAAPVWGSATPRPHPVAPVLHTLPLAAVAHGAQALGAADVALPARSTSPFSVVGVTWRPTATPVDVDVQVRTRSTGGTWSAWRDLHGQTDDTADGGQPDVADPRTREGTAPAYVGPSDGVQVRADVLSGLAPQDLRVDLVDPGTSPADARTAPRDTAGASVTQPPIVTRAEWGADESIRSCDAGYTGPARVAFVHHTDSSNDYAPDEAPAAVRGFYAYHVKSRGWCDIGYNFLVDRYGVLYEGRAGGIDRYPLGAHTGGFNTNSFGTAMIGDFTSVSPPQALQDSLRDLIAWKLGRTYADPTGTARLTAVGSGSKYPSGTTVTFNVVSGHRDAVDTTCPGDLGYRILGSLRTAVRARMGAGLVAPSATPASVAPGGTVTVGSGLLEPVGWSLTVTSSATGAVVRTVSGSATDRIDTAWDLRDDAGLPVAPGRYALTLSGAAGGDPVVPWTTTVTVQAPPGSTPAPTATPTATPTPTPSRTATATPTPTPSRTATATPSRTATATPSPTRSATPKPVSTPTRTAPSAASTGGASFVPLSPVRVLDTRDGTGGRSTPVGAGETYDVVLAGRGGVPADATAVALNLTGTHATSGTHLTVWPAGGAQPDTSVLGLRPGTTAASLVVAGLGTGGAASVRNLAGTVDLVGDVVGYWTRTGGALYHPVAPARLLDTRDVDGGGRFADQETRTLTVRGNVGVPSTATGVVLNVTAVGPQRAGFLTVTPSGARAGTSSVNFAAGETVPNRVVTGLSSAGAVDVFSAGSTHVLVDVVGWFAPPVVTGGGAFTAVAPSRLVDSRDGTGTPKGAFGPQVTRDVQVTGNAGVPAGATAVVVTLTATGPSASQGFVTAFADGTSRPGTSDLNLVQGATRSNLAVVPLSSAGRMSLYNESGTTQVIVDVLGYVAP